MGNPSLFGLETSAKCSKFESLHPEEQIFLSFETGLSALLRMKENLRLERRSDPY